jgi:RNA polymerase sigma-70 factor (ECF subfamily)
VAEKNFEEIQYLIEGCLQSDREAQRKLYRYFYGYAMSVCVRYSKSNEEAREVLNDGFMKVFTKIEKYDSEKSFKGWLRRIMINTALDNYRHNFKHYHHRDLEAAEHEVTSETITHQFSHAELMVLIQRLSPAYRAVFNLYAIDGYTHEEISEMLGISVGTSKSNLFKARANLQAMLKKSQPDEYRKYA